MRRLIELSKSAATRINPRIAVGIVAAVTAGLIVWKGVGYFRPKPAAPTKQIAIGEHSVGGSGAVVQAAGSLTDDQPPATTSGSYQLAQYQQLEPPPTQPQTNPYLTTNGDPASGYSASRAAASQYGSQYSTQSSPYAATVPADPSTTQPPPTSVPENPYRTSDAASTIVSNAAAGQGTYPPLSQSPYAAAASSANGGYGSPAAEAPPTTAAANDLSPTAAAASVFGNRYGGQATSQPTTTQQPPTTEATAPPSALPPAESSINPYASASQPMRPLDASSSGSGLGQYRSSSPQSSALPRGEGAGRLATPTPGERHLEGPQQPSIALEKVSPSEIQVGKPATFELYVRNAGQVPAQNVVVTDHVPAGTQLIDARPPPQQSSDGSLVWNIGTLQPGEETQITLQVMPQTEGEVGSTAHVTFAAAATSRSICTRPQLAIEHSAPPKVLIGEGLTVGITVSNPGTGPATGVIIEEDVPPGLSHVAGSQLEYEVGTLRPGESKRLELSLRAEKAGIVQNRIQVRGEANLAAQHAVQIEVVAPQLQVAVEGPKRRFLERQATYALQVSNPGTAAAREVELVAFLPRGMKFVTTDSQGQYDPTQHAVFWSLAELPPAKAGAVKLTTLPVEPGEQRLRIEGRAALGLTAVGEQVVQVEQAAELLHTVKDLDEVIEVGSETTYEIRVTNKGTKAATNVRVTALVPGGMAATSGEGPTRASGDATQVIFEPLARLNPQEEVIYKVQVQGRQPGDHLVRVQLSSDEWPTPVTREESTRVYQDR
jgi:uncharacterized repeat protein (TIGR01451 family)